jgi:hypothetical protein
MSDPADKGPSPKTAFLARSITASSASRSEKSAMEDDGSICSVSPRSMKSGSLSPVPGFDTVVAVSEQRIEQVVDVVMEVKSTTCTRTSFTAEEEGCGEKEMVVGEGWSSPATGPGEGGQARFVDFESTAEAAQEESLQCKPANDDMPFASPTNGSSPDRDVELSLQGDDMYSSGKSFPVGALYTSTGGGSSPPRGSSPPDASTR